MICAWLLDKTFASPSSPTLCQSVQRYTTGKPKWAGSTHSHVIYQTLNRKIFLTSDSDPILSSFERYFNCNYAILARTKKPRTCFVQSCSSLEICLVVASGIISMEQQCARYQLGRGKQRCTRILSTSGCIR